MALLRYLRIGVKIIELQNSSVTSLFRRVAEGKHVVCCRLFPLGGSYITQPV